MDEAQHVPAHSPSVSSMQVRVNPDDLTAAGTELSSDGPTLRAAANVLSAHGFAQGAQQPPVLGAALGDLLGVEVALLTTLAEAAETLTWGLNRAGTAYRSSRRARRRSCVAPDERAGSRAAVTRRCG